MDREVVAVIYQVSSKIKNSVAVLTLMMVMVIGMNMMVVKV